MAVGTHTFTSAGATVTWTPATGNSYPVRTTDAATQRVVDSAGSKRYVLDKGQRVLVHELTFVALSKTDRDGLLTFLRHADVNFALKTWTWNDLENVNHTVRFDLEVYEDVERAFQVFGPVVLRLREEV